MEVKKYNRANHSQTGKRRTFIDILASFIRSNKTDVITYDGKKYLRSGTKDVASSINTQIKELKSKASPISTLSNQLSPSSSIDEQSLTELTEKYSSLQLMLNSNLKTSFPEAYMLTDDLASPFDTLNISSKTQIQQFVEKHLPLFPKYQAFLYTASCGSGKTLAGIYAIYKTKCKTLIISHRNAISDQWERVIHKCFPTLRVETRSEVNDSRASEYNLPDGTIITRRKKTSALTNKSDIYILSPQYLANKVDTLKLDVGLIIYDEIHCLTSDVFSEVLKFPFLCCLDDRFQQLPYCIGLSATLPPSDTKEHELLLRMFGKPFTPASVITKQPINVWDYRNIFTEVRRGKLDDRYEPLGEYESIHYFVNLIDKEGAKHGILYPRSSSPSKLSKTESPELVPSIKYKGIIISYTIASSMWTALYVHKHWNVNVLIIRAAHESCVLLEENKGLDYEFNELITQEQFYADLPKFGSYCSMHPTINNCAIICGCLPRLKEGFSIESATWGIITKFVWSVASRVQLLGRIRRMSTDEDLNTHERIFYVCSGKCPNNLYQLYNYKYKRNMRLAHAHAVLDYPFEYERLMFKKENIIVLEDPQEKIKTLSFDD